MFEFLISLPNIFQSLTPCGSVLFSFPILFCLCSAYILNIAFQFSVDPCYVTRSHTIDALIRWETDQKNLGKILLKLINNSSSQNKGNHYRGGGLKM